MSVEISPATTTRPVVISVSHATRPPGSSARTASRIVSEIWSATLSGWPSVTDSEVNRNSRGTRGRLLDRREAGQPQPVAVAAQVEHARVQGFRVRARLRRDDAAAPLGE